MNRILVIDGDQNLRPLLRRVIGEAGFDVVNSATGMTGLATALVQDFALIILDLTLPDVAGEHVLHAIVSVKPWARVFVLSAVSDNRRRVAALEGGAVDFLPKPFDNAELVARIRARIRSGEPGLALGPSRSLRAGKLELDLSHRLLILDGKRIELSRREFDLLAYLIDRKGEICTRQELLGGVWDLSIDPGTHVVDVCVRRLRAKLEENTIETIRKVGYRLVA